MDKKVAALLNEQINKELYSAYLYLDMANFYASKGLDGFANWFEIQAREEQDHAMLIYKYLHNNSHDVTLEAIAKAENLEAEEEAIEAEYQKMADAYGIEVDKVRGVVAQENIALNLRLNKAIDLIKSTAKVTDAPKEEAAEAPKEEAPKEKAPRKRRTTKAKAEEAAEESKDAE